MEMAYASSNLYMVDVIRRIVITQQLELKKVNRKTRDSIDGFLLQKEPKYPLLRLIEQIFCGDVTAHHERNIK